MSEPLNKETDNSKQFDSGTEINSMTDKSDSIEQDKLIQSESQENVHFVQLPATPTPTTTNEPLRTIQYDAGSSPQVLEKQLSKAKRDLESMVIKYARSESENLLNKSKIDDLDKKLKRAIKDNESLANRIRILTNDKNSITDTLNAKLAQLTVLEQRNNSLSNVQTVKLKEIEEKCVQLEKTNEELLKQIDTHKNKEGELLDFSERLSMKHMLLQTELEKALSNAPDYKLQNEQLLVQNQELAKRNRDYQALLEDLTNKLEKEKDRNTELSDELEESKLNYRNRIDELENEMKVMRRKHQIAIKEIHKQMKQVVSANDLQRENEKLIKS